MGQIGKEDEKGSTPKAECEIKQQETTYPLGSRSAHKGSRAYRGQRASIATQRNREELEVKYPRLIETPPNEKKKEGGGPFCKELGQTDTKENG